MTICPRCLGEKTLPTLRLVRGHWLPIANDPCPNCQGTGLQTEHTCKFCGMELRSDKIGPYCSDVCEFRAFQPIVIDNARFKIKATVEAPSGGWLYGESVTLQQNGYAVEIRIGLGGCVMSRIRKAETAIMSGVITVEKIK